MTAPDLTIRRRAATITAVDAATSTATVQWADGATTTAGVPWLASYSAAVSDIVLVDLAAGSPLIVGAVQVNLALPDVQTNTSGAGPTAAAVELTVMTSSAITLDGRTRVRVTFGSARIDTTVAADVFTFAIKDNGTAVRARRYNTPGAAADGVGFDWVSGTAPSAGSHTFTVTVLRSAGTGTLTVNGSATNLIQLSVAEFQ